MEIRATEITIVPLTQIKLNPKNRNKHSKEQIDHLAKIIAGSGFRRPGTISNQSGYLTCGEARYLAAKQLGLYAMPVMFQDYDSQEQEYADGIADNALDKWAELDLAGVNADLPDMGPDFDIDLLGIKDFVLEPAEKFAPQADEDEVPEHVEPKTKPGDIYTLGRHRLMCGDSTSIDAVEKLMAGEKAEMVFTDPPYGISYSAEKMNLPNAQKFEVLKNDDRDVKELIQACLFFDCPKVIWGANNFINCLPHKGVWFAWDKRSNSLEDQSLADGVFGSQFELAWVDKESGYQKLFRVKHAGFVNADGGKRHHPTQKPSKLIIDVLEHEAAKKHVVDLFGGSGSTLIACEKTNRQCFMMELDPHYCDVIVARWEKYTGQKAELNGPPD